MNDFPFKDKKYYHRECKSLLPHLEQEEQQELREVLNRSQITWRQLGVFDHCREKARERSSQN